MHETLSQINQVDGFNPLEFARTIPSSVEGQPPNLYLDVKYRIAWFRLKYPQGKISKEIKKLDENMAVVECFIYKDAGESPDAFLANGFGQRSLDSTTAYGSRFLECAETAAVGRALSAAGFNISSGSDEDGEENPVDSGVPISGTAANTAAAPLNQPPQASPPRPTPARTAPPPAEGQSPKFTHNMPVEEILKVMTVDDAKKVKIPFKGQNNGKTFAQVALEDPKTLGWIVDSYSGPDNTLRAAARKLLAA